jgi:hypothetical protein
MKQDVVEKDNVFSVDLPMQLSRDQADVYSKVSMLKRAVGHINSAELNQTLTNMEVLAFGISWFGLVSVFIDSFHSSFLKPG